MAVAHNGTGDAQVSELIGRTAYMPMQLYRSRGLVMSLDQTIPDYAFYDRLRRGKEPGYKLGALFAPRIEHIFSTWVFGRGVTVKLAEGGNADNPDDPRNATDALLKEFIDAEHAQLMRVKKDALGLGMQYIFVNPDGTLSIPSPDTVEETFDELDYRTLRQVKITTKLPSGWTIEDVYTSTARTITYKKGSEERVERYPILIGRIPYVRIAHAQSGNELYGHSIHEDLLKLYDQYDDVIHKQLDGAKLLGNPLLAIWGLKDLTAVIDANKPATQAEYYDREGNVVTRPELNIDTNSILLIGEGGMAGFIAPPVGFSADTQQSLKTLFLLLMDRTGIPEFIWGNELSSARASSDTQMMQWAHDIEGQQTSDEGWLLDLCDIWLAYKALTMPVVIDALKAEWPPVLDENREQRLKELEFAASQNLLTDKTKLELTELPVEDAGEEVQKAAGEAQARADDAMARQQAMQPPMPQANGQGTPVAQMAGNGYNEAEASAIVAGAIRTLAGGE
jgi:hypothetical protein